MMVLILLELKIKKKKTSKTRTLINKKKGFKIKAMPLCFEKKQCGRLLFIQKRMQK